jgi:hypothetical protein
MKRLILFKKMSVFVRIIRSTGHEKMESVVLLQVDYLLTYSLTPWSRVLLEKLTGPQLVKKFPTFYGTRRFITTFTSAQPPVRILSQINLVHVPHPTS